VVKTRFAPSPAGSLHVGNATLARFRELVERSNGDLDPKELLRELQAVGGDLKALRLALTGRDRGPELWTVIAALPREELLRRTEG
jgi:glutamyl/glutaminyl-tRNA synthetase